MIQQQSPSGSPQIKAKMCRYRLHIYINMSKYWLRRNRTTDFSCVLLLHQHDIVALLMKEKQICFNETLLLFINWKLFLEIFITYFSEDLCDWPHFIWQLAMIIIRKQALEVKDLIRNTNFHLCDVRYGRNYQNLQSLSLCPWEERSLYLWLITRSHWAECTTCDLSSSGLAMWSEIRPFLVECLPFVGYISVTAIAGKRPLTLINKTCQLEINHII